ncbi:MAG: hypothetical protein L0099_08695, partial [Acidobacteria bacterium]|nr:hypothetical protein [Acidobacteriota bacterium]
MPSPTHFSPRLSAASALCLLAVLLTAPSHAQDALAEVFASDATVRGSVVLAGSGTRVLSGSSISAGAQAAVVRLVRGGEVRVCSGNSVTLASATAGRELLWGVGTGAIEVHYALPGSADTLMTPDFRLLLAGPGAFHFALSSDNRGNTCVRSLAGASSSVIVQEIAGSGSYQVRPGDQVLFHNGRMSEADTTTPLSCGCPAPPAVHRAENQDPKPEPKPEPEKAAATPPEPAPVAEAVKPPLAAPPAAAMKAAEPEVEDTAANLSHTNPLAGLPPGLPPPSPAEVTAPLPAQPPGEVQIQVDAPFVFQAEEPIPETAPLIARVSVGSLPQWPNFEPVVLPPPAPPPPPQQAQAEPGPKPKKKRGFFGFFRAIFASI